MSRVAIEPIDSNGVFKLLTDPSKDKFDRDRAVRLECGSFSLPYPAGSVQLNGYKFEMSTDLHKQFTEQDIGDLCNELNLRVFASLGEGYGAKVGTDRHGWPAILVTRRIEIEGFTFDEKIAQFAFTPGRVLAFDFCPEQTDVRIATHVAEEGTVALRLSKDFIDATFRLRNELPPKQSISISARA